MTDTLNETLKFITDTLGQLYGLPGYVLVYLLCLGLGFALKKSKWFPNEGIPLTIILVGAVFTCLIADPRGDTLPLRVWIVKNVVFGALIGIAAWATHANRRRIPFIKRFFKDDGNSDPAAFVNPNPKPKDP